MWQGSEHIFIRWFVTDVDRRGGDSFSYQAEGTARRRSFIPRNIRTKLECNIVHGDIDSIPANNRGGMFQKFCAECATLAMR
ncbi:hypothetical protein A2765_05070 [Candidatus Kaiserbacteria bacterium RIFCSPHIGHO2_01_FULL_56_24]|uniref:Uncharacterized protein n=1 Tax=Candidatus Kaiserbacteria bacterium RIFCSPHIGHO2_01_FULL_56_24 TaxID=1798487 RepID=A0A1F6D8S4_9BACT|nr:MAG: hypothetical protein A2765_05070 [Candidatus Kaiserbacteria bacterium RIFCSPHIGHO2_01_FULL_56_24]